MADAPAPLYEQIRTAIRSKGWTQKDVAEALQQDPGNFSRMLKGDRGLPLELAERVAALIGWELPAHTIVWHARRQVPVISIGALPMGLSGADMAAALLDLTSERMPDLTGEKGVFYIRLDAPSGGFQTGPPGSSPAPRGLLLFGGGDREELLARKFCLIVVVDNCL